MDHFLIVVLGGGLGAGLRYLSGILAVRLLGPGFPWGTLFVNVAGSLAMGLLIGWLARRSGTSHELRLLLATGFLGGFTTFSAFSLDVVNMMERHQMLAAFSYVTASVLLSILAVFLGLWLARSI